jgi:LemA protein
MNVNGLVGRWRSLLLVLAVPVFLAGCGVNTIPTKDEQVKAAWGDVQNQYQRRSDLIPNLVSTVQVTRSRNAPF